ncbi:potassium channel family protein [Oceanomicrobium pacificus]|uniref:Two pore domain potassium channel family protein n=1 Tax=Oceanomicrobium pacificus TaxID=2692916 RepID=A0A6B0U6P7_9RHOB|nr:potassium channel family protein [Oceanomicrobium pacificus]MXU66521.1 two pore domain potassium channel family protein [Oceanomicrobium pacificus]
MEDALDPDLVNVLLRQALLIGGLVAILNVGIMSIFASVAFRILGIAQDWVERGSTGVRFLVLAAVCVVWVQFAATCCVWVWAALYMHLDLFTDFEEALYFSAVTFTTLGYGDVLLEEGWRLIAGIEAMNGLLMFGFFTAILIELIRRMRRNFDSNKHHWF